MIRYSNYSNVYYSSLRKPATTRRGRAVLWGLLFLAVCVACVGLMLLFMERKVLSWIEMTGLVPRKSMKVEEIKNDTYELTHEEREEIRVRSVDFDPRDPSHPWYGRILQTVENQYYCGSCVSFATAHMLADRYNLLTMSSNQPRVRVSPQSLLNAYPTPACNEHCDARCNRENLNNSKCQCGTDVLTIQEACINAGVLIEDGNDCTLPYTASSKNGVRVPPLDNHRANPEGCPANNMRIRISDRGLVRTNDEVMAERQLRLKGTLCAIIEVPPFLYQHQKSQEVLEPPAPGSDPNRYPKGPHGLHMVCVVGATRNAWIIRNSWGPEVHEKGFFRLKKNVNALRIADWGFFYPRDDVVRV